MDNGWKNFFKENALLFLVFFVVVFGFIGLTVYNMVNDVKDKNTIYDRGALIEAPDIVKTYDVNEYKIITKDDYDLAEYYLKQLVTMWNKDPGKLYDLMNDKCKNEYSSRDEAVKKLTKLRSSRVLQSKIDSYKVEKGVVIILTDQGIEFKLSTNGINNYKIIYMGQV